MAFPYLCSMDFEQKLADLNARCAHTFMETLGIRYVELTEDRLVAEMAVTSALHQPMGLLHGGATVALAETVGSAFSFVQLGENASLAAVGQEISANHIRSVREGIVRATARFLHIGRRSHVLEIRVEDSEGRLVSFLKMTNALIPKKPM